MTKNDKSFQHIQNKTKDKGGEKMKNIYSKILKITIALTIFINIVMGTQVHADVGGIQRYDSSTSSSSSSSSGSYSSSDWDSDSSSGSISLGGLIIFVIIIAISIYIKKHGGNINDLNNVDGITKMATNMLNLDDNTKAVAEQIRQVDPMFSEDDFLSWTKEVFIKLQNAWTKKDWKIIRPFESNELFEQHNSQLQEFIDKGRTNIVERINVTNATLYSFKQDGDKETLKVTLKAVMRDYILDDQSKKVLEGNPNIDQYMTYRLTFIRKAGVKTKQGTSNKSTTNCPNCGAPTQITSAGQCEYCGSVITTGEHDWVLANLEGV